MKYSFKNDYSEGAHPSILEALSASNDTQENGYGLDDYSKKASDQIKNICKNPLAKIYFVAGGTLANLLVISALLKPYESVISAQSGHINTNETGAIEHSGFKIHAVHTDNGKLTPEAIFPVLQNHQNFPHQVKPKLVYISNSTEVGTVYSLQELKELYDFCRSNNLYLFMDGARLGNALVSEDQLNLKVIAQYTDIFYIGGTKNGGLFGEAIVVNRPELLTDFDFHLKQKGALLAKGRILGVQFSRFFEDELYFKLAKKANESAQKIRAALENKNVKFLSDSATNQIFPILENTVIDKLLEDFEFYKWSSLDESQSSIRLITSWSTSKKAVNLFIEKINLYL